MTAAAPRTLAGHGTPARYKRGCRNACCRNAINAEKRRTRRLTAYGRWNRWTDAQPVRDHIAALNAYGIGVRQAAELAGLRFGTVSHWLYGRPGYPQPPRIKTALAQRMLAVRPVLANVADRARIDDIGTVRRLQALVAVGWPAKELASRLSLDVTGTPRLLRSRRVTGATARSVRVLFAELWNADPVAAGIPAHIAERSRLRAGRNGWAPPAAWDSLDDPLAVPDFGEAGDRVAALVEDAEYIRETAKATWQHVAERLAVDVDTLHTYRGRVRDRAAADAGGAA